MTTGQHIEQAMISAGITQRTLAKSTGIPQTTLSRIIRGTRDAKTPELVAIAWATGASVAELAGSSTVADRVECLARATDGSTMEGMRRELLHMLELNAYLDDQAIPAA